MGEIIRGYKQDSGGCLVTVNGAVLGLPPISADEARHSPSGFQWGYGGSGPAELARAVLLAVRPDAVAERVVRHPRCYQEFKSDVISKLSGDFTLTSDTVQGWLARWVLSEKGIQTVLDVAEIEALEALGKEEGS